jgi:hypothetical protein
MRVNLIEQQETAAGYEPTRFRNQNFQNFLGGYPE